MRTTVTLDDDVAALLAELSRKKGMSQKELVNAGLRSGLRELEGGGRKKPRREFRTAAVDAGRCLVPSIDNTADTLAFLDGEAYR